MNVTSQRLDSHMRQNLRCFLRPSQYNISGGFGWEKTSLSISFLKEITFRLILQDTFEMPHLKTCREKKSLVNMRFGKTHYSPLAPRALKPISIWDNIHMFSKQLSGRI